MTWGSIPIGCSEGYVVARVDIRGTGRSEGELPDREYSEQEFKDGEGVIAWLVAQSSSNGSVGMMGISWGGFNSIQMAMRQPPALKAIIAVDATEDLFKDDIHYIDGLMHADEYELSMDLQPAMTRPPHFPTDESSLRARFDAKPWFPIYFEFPAGRPVLGSGFAAAGLLAGEDPGVCGGRILRRLPG